MRPRSRGISTLRIRAFRFNQDEKHLPRGDSGGGQAGQDDDFKHQASEYVLLNAIGSTELQDGKYLYSPATKQIEVHWIQGIGSASAPAPQARLMATVINGILSRKLPWGLVLLGVSLVIAVELLGIRSLTFAVGAYLPIGTTLPIFAGGVVRWIVDRAAAAPGTVRQRAIFRRDRCLLQD